MTRKPDHFSHGFGAMMRAAAGFKYRLIVLALCMISCAAMTVVFAFNVTLTTREKTLVAWHVRADAAMLAPLPTMRTFQVAWHGREYVTNADEVRSSDEVNAAWAKAVRRCGAAAILGACAGVFLAFLGYRRIAARGREIVGDKHLRGALVADEKELADAAEKVAKGKSERGPFAHLGGVPIPRHLEPRNFLIAGTVGAGKTTAMRQLLDTADARGEAVVLHDPSGDLVSCYYRPDRGDVILNPYTAQAAAWDTFADVHTRGDAQLIAESIAQPKQGQRDIEWLGYVRDYVADAIWALKTTGRGTTDELLRVLGFSDKDALAALVDRMPSRRMFERGAERATASVVFGLPAVLNVLAAQRWKPGAGGVFSWTRWAEQVDEGGAMPWVFLGAPERQFPVVRALITAHVNVAAANLLSLDPYRKGRRVWVMLDEFASLPAMESIPRLSAQGRKYGTALVIGIQSPSQLVETYGREAANTLVTTAGTQLILRLPGGESAQWASRQLGRQEVERRMENDTFDTEESHARSNVGVTREVRDLVLDSEVAGLQDLHGFLALPAVGVGRVVIPTSHLSRPRSAGLQPADPDDLWLAHMGNFRGDSTPPTSGADPGFGL